MMRNRHFGILLVEDNSTDVLLIREALADVTELDYELYHVEHLDTAIARASESSVDVVLLDLGLPDSRGVETFVDFHQQHRNIPVIVLTAIDDLELGLQTLHEGAQDYLLKKELQPSLLGRAIRYAVERQLMSASLATSRLRLRNLANKLQDAREEERIRISRDLHDDLGQKLSALKMDLRLLENRLKSLVSADTLRMVTERVGKSMLLVNDMVETVQRIAFELRPSSLDHLGLVGAMREEARRFEARTGIHVQLVFSEECERKSSELATTLFRIFQELLTNIARHAEASEASVTYSESDIQYLLEVVDDGVGMPGEAIRDNESLGLLGMQERAATNGGAITFDSAPGRGTRVSVSIPKRRLRGGLM